MTIVVGLYGAALRPQIDAQHSAIDFYSLFHARSVGLGYLTDAAEGGTRRLWAMNDAGTGADFDDPFLAAWFQVDSTAQPGTAIVQPILACVEDVLGRSGTFTADQVSLMASVQAPIDTDRSVNALAESREWFASSTESVRNDAHPISLEVGSSPPATEDILRSSLDWIGAELYQDVLTTERTSPIQRVEHPATVVRSHLDHGYRGFQVEARLCEWTLTSIAWSMDLLLTAIAAGGHRGSAVISIRSDG